MCLRRRSRPPGALSLHRHQRQPWLTATASVMAHGLTHRCASCMTVRAATGVWQPLLRHCPSLAIYAQLLARRSSQQLALLRCVGVAVGKWQAAARLTSATSLAKRAVVSMTVPVADAVAACVVWGCACALPTCEAAGRCNTTRTTSRLRTNCGTCAHLAAAHSVQACAVCSHPTPHHPVPTRVAVMPPSQAVAGEGAAALRGR